MAGDGRVVVVVDINYGRRRTEDMCVARIEPLGLTGFGRDYAEAERAVVSLFHSYVVFHRNAADLESELDRVGMTREYEEGYRGDPPAIDAATFYEHASHSARAGSTDNAGQSSTLVRTRSNVEENWEEPSRRLVAAA